MMKPKNENGKPIRAAFEKIVNENGITQEELDTFIKIGSFMAQAQNEQIKYCGISVDKCYSGDCGYSEGGCGTDEKCRVCDNCMVMWDTCSSSMCGTADS